MDDNLLSFAELVARARRARQPGPSEVIDLTSLPDDEVARPLPHVTSDGGWRLTLACSLKKLHQPLRPGSQHAQLLRQRTRYRPSSRWAHASAQGPRDLLFARLTKTVIWNDSDSNEHGTIS